MGRGSEMGNNSLRASDNACNFLTFWLGFVAVLSDQESNTERLG